MDYIVNSAFGAVVITLLAYEIGCIIKKRFKIAIFNPLLISIVLIIGLVLCFNIDYQVYKNGSQIISYLLTPATVALAIPLYEQIEQLKKNWKAIILGISSGALTSAVCVLDMSYLFRINHQMYVTMLPKSITTAIGMGLSEEMGGIVTITVAVIIVTGIFGNMTAEFVCKIFNITEPVAKGIGIGSAAHAMGTTKAMEIGESEGALSSLSIAVSGIMTVVVASVFAYFY